MIILLPPSEGKTSGGEGLWVPSDGDFGQALGEARCAVIEGIKSALHSGQMRNSGRINAVGTNKLVVEGEAPVMAASRRYTGVVWKHIDPDTLGQAGCMRASDSVSVVSGLGGLFGWDSLVPDYRLKMGSTLPVVGVLASHWSRHLTELVMSRAAGGPVIDLLPIEHARAFVVPLQYADQWTRVELVDAEGGRSGHNGKAAKGRLVRALLQTVDPVDRLGNYADANGFSIHRAGPLLVK